MVGLEVGRAALLGAGFGFGLWAVVRRQNAGCEFYPAVFESIPRHECIWLGHLFVTIPAFVGWSSGFRGLGAPLLVNDMSFHGIARIVSKKREEFNSNTKQSNVNYTAVPANFVDLHAMFQRFPYEFRGFPY